MHEPLGDDPPLGLCPAHPGRPAWRTCRRCGRFLCALCTNPTAQGPYCGECLALKPKKPAALGGWLWLAGLSLVATPLFSFWQVSVVVEHWREFSSDARSLVEAAVAGLAGAFALYVLPQFVLRRRAVPRLMVLFFGGAALLDFGAQLADSVIAGQSTFAMPDAVRALVRLMWVAYFMTSPRVRETFVTGGPA